MRILEVLRSIFDLILPRRPRSVRIETLLANDLLPSPTEHEACGIRIITLTDYRTGTVEDCVRALKYDQSARAATLFAAILADYLQEEISSLRVFSSRTVLLVPIPLHGARTRERGFNQMELVLHELPQEFRDGTVSHLELRALTRTRSTKPQTRLSRRERLTNMSDAFTADASIVRGAHVFLIDDVTTTGATLAEAAKTLEAAGASVSAIALARA